MSKLHNFLSASMRTRYTVDLPSGDLLTLNIGLPNPEIDRLLNQFQASTYAYLTAFNPQSTSLSPAENWQRHQQLCRQLSQSGFTFLTGKAIPASAEWEPEICIFAFDMARAAVLDICQSYAQDGAVVGEHGSAPKLMFTNPGLREDFKILLHSCVLD
jgi:hypothetical protein